MTPKLDIVDRVYWMVSVKYKRPVTGLEFDGGTAAIFRRALATGRNALWIKQ